MTFAELVLLIAIGLLIYRLLAPIRRRVEFRLARFFRTQMRTSTHKPIIDITDYKKKTRAPKNED